MEGIDAEGQIFAKAANADAITTRFYGGLVWSATEVCLQDSSGSGWNPFYVRWSLRGSLSGIALKKGGMGVTIR
jgi:hypothetical protein